MASSHRVYKKGRIVLNGLREFPHGRKGNLGKRDLLEIFYPRFGGCFASSGVLISGRIWVIGKHWYSSHAQWGHFRRSCSDLSSSYSRPQSIHTYFPGPTLLPAFTCVGCAMSFTSNCMWIDRLFMVFVCSRGGPVFWKYMPILLHGLQ